jgi:UDP-GlcNAc:undecaprenyl-phosphate GlcNAc-1-phosphate transferase
MLTALLLILVSACASALLLTPLARALAGHIRLLDRPDGRRKLHPRVTPLAGGLVLLTCCTAVLAAAALLPGQAGEVIAGSQRTFIGLLLAGVVVCAVGVLDDYGHLRGPHKLAGQVIAVSVLLSFGLVVRRVGFFGAEVELGLLAVPATGLWLLGAINALNLIDGMDGLLTSVGLVISLALAFMAALMGHWAAACMACALAGSLLGFLRYNFPPASVFLGDNGSMLIGLAVGALAIEGSMKGPATVVLAAPAALLTVPFFDTAVAIARRKLTGRSIYVSDRGHLHHCLLRAGCSPRQVLLGVGLACLLTAAGALASVAWQSELIALLAAFTVVGIFLSTRLFGHAELVLLNGSLRRLVGSLVPSAGRPDGRRLEVRLQGSAAWQEVWSELVGCAAQLDLVAVRFTVNAPALQEGYHARWDCGQADPDEPRLWRASVPLAVDGQVVAHLEVSGRAADQPASVKLADLAKLAEHFEGAVTALAGSHHLAALRYQPAASNQPPDRNPTAEEEEVLNVTPLPSVQQQVAEADGPSLMADG